MLQLSTIKLCKSAHATTRTYFERRFMTYGHFESTFSKYAFGRGGGGHKKEYAVYARENDDNYGRPLRCMHDVEGYACLSGMCNRLQSWYRGIHPIFFLIYQFNYFFCCHFLPVTLGLGQCLSVITLTLNRNICI